MYNGININTVIHLDFLGKRTSLGIIAETSSFLCLELVQSNSFIYRNVYA